MRRAVCIFVLSVSFIAGNVASWQVTLAGESSGAEVSADMRAIAPPMPVATEDTQAAIGACTYAGDFQLCENEGWSFVVARVKAIDRVYEVARSSLRRRTTELSTLLWVRTVSASLSLRNVRLQV